MSTPTTVRIESIDAMDSDGDERNDSNKNGASSTDEELGYFASQFNQIGIDDSRAAAERVSRCCVPGET